MTDWTVFKVNAVGAKLTLVELCTVQGTAADDAIISACEKHRADGKFVAFPAEDCYGREVEAFSYIRFAD